MRTQFIVGRTKKRLTGFADGISTPAEFLKAIGRDAESKVNAESWDELWKLNGHELKKAGLAVRDRRCVAFSRPHNTACQPHCRYILWCMEKFRQGAVPSEYAHPAQPKKKIRGCVELYAVLPLTNAHALQMGTSGPGW